MKKNLNDTINEFEKTEQEMFQEFISEASSEASSQFLEYSQGIEAKPKDLKLDQIVEITQELPNGNVKKFKFKIIEVWPTPTHFFTVISIKKPADELNFWTLFFDNTWYIKKANKSLINVHVKLI